MGEYLDNDVDIVRVHSEWYDFGLWRLCVGCKRVYNHENKILYCILYAELVLGVVATL